jgi:hypothetical protein
MLTIECENIFASVLFCKMGDDNEHRQLC